MVTPEHFQAMYQVCDTASMPKDLQFEPSVWWQALLVFAITTGWRIEENLWLRQDDVDWTTGAILTRAADNKGKRETIDYLPDVTLMHMTPLVGSARWYSSGRKIGGCWTANFSAFSSRQGSICRVDFRDISHQHIKQVENLLNHRPRACLEYNTPPRSFLRASHTPALPLKLATALPCCLGRVSSAICSTRIRFTASAFSSIPDGSTFAPREIFANRWDLTGRRIEQFDDLFILAERRGR